MEKKKLDFIIPDYLTLEQYSKMSINTEDKVERMITIISALTGYDIKEVRTWSLPSLTKIFKKYSSLVDTKNEFHSIIEWNGELLGYSHINEMSLGCYADLEALSKDLNNNLHKVAAILYRPIVSHNFDTIEFMVKQKVKMAKNKVENVFDWYKLQEYDLDIRKKREEKLKQFPAHILLGALSFFLGTASLYLSNIVYSDKKISKIMKEKLQPENQLLKELTQNIGAGGGLFTTSLSPIYSRLQEISA